MKKILIVLGTLFVLLVLAYLFQQNSLKEGVWIDGVWYNDDELPDFESSDDGDEGIGGWGRDAPQLVTGEQAREFAWNDETGYLPSGEVGINVGPGNSEQGEYMPGGGKVSAEGPPFTITDHTGRYTTDRVKNQETGRYRVLTQEPAYPRPGMPTGTEFDPNTGTTVMTHNNRGEIEPYDSFGNPTGFGNTDINGVTTEALGLE